MSSLGTKQLDKLDGSYLYETKQLVSQSYHLEWTIQNFTHLTKSFEGIERPFFTPASDSEHKLFFKVRITDSNRYGNEHIIDFILYAPERFKEYVNVSLFLKSGDHGYEPFCFKTQYVTSSEFILYKTESRDFYKKVQCNPYPPQDLTIICEVSLADSIQDFQKQKQVLKFNDDIEISDHRNFILNDDSIKDFSFVVQNQTLHVPKLLLALESPVFAAMFKMSEGLNSKAIITDTEPEIFMKMIQFIYDQKVNQADLEKSAPELLKVAHNYDVIKLKQICAAFLYDKLCVDNAFEILLLADLYSISGLYEEALKIIKLNLNLFKDLEDFKKFIKERPHLVLELLEVNEESGEDFYKSLSGTKIRH